MLKEFKGWKRIFCWPIFCWITMAAAWPSSMAPVVIGSKAFSESILLSEVLAVLLEERFKIPVVRKHNLGGTQVVFEAIKRGEIDLYPEYTGTGYISILGLSGEKRPDKIFHIVSRRFRDRYGLTWGRPLGFNNTYALAMRKNDQRFAAIEKISQLRGREQSLRFLSPHEFMERKDGLPGMIKAYQLDFKEKDVLAMNVGLIYSAIRDGEGDLIVAYSTDGRIAAYGMKLLEDDLSFFPPYYAAFLYREDSGVRFPALKQAIALLEGRIREAQMVKMNDLVDRLKQDPQSVARNFLIEQKLIEGTLSPLIKQQNFWSFVLFKKDYLLEIIGQHLILSLISLSAAILLSLPIGIAMSRWESLAKIIFPIVNTLQTIPSLALLGFLIPFVGIGQAPALLGLFIYGMLPLVQNTYTGLKEIDPLFIEVSRGIGLNPLQILIRVEIPLAMPVILAGVRVSAVIIVGTATLASLVGGGGLGDPIFRGVATVNTYLILLGTIPAAFLAIAIDRCLGQSEKYFVSRGLRLKHDNA